VENGPNRVNNDEDLSGDVTAMPVDLMNTEQVSPATCDSSADCRVVRPTTARSRAVYYVLADATAREVCCPSR
jgi:hypothetical protein